MKEAGGKGVLFSEGEAAGAGEALSRHAPENGAPEEGQRG